MIDVRDDSTSGTPRALIDQPGPLNLVVSDWAALSVQGRQRLTNEDGWKQLGPLFMVADGMGGLIDGQDTSSLAVASVANRWLAAGDPMPEEVVRGANSDVRAAMASKGIESGCTLTAVRIAHDTATVVHVGDSRLYRVRAGQAEQLTRDHNLRSELLAAGIVPRASQSLGPLQALTSYLGINDSELQVDVRSVGLRAGDRLLLCTDGVFNDLNHSELAQILRTGDAHQVADALTSTSHADDATAVVVDIDRADLPRVMHP